MPYALTGTLKKMIKGRVQKEEDELQHLPDAVERGAEGMVAAKEGRGDQAGAGHERRHGSVKCRHAQRTWVRRMPSHVFGAASAVCACVRSERRVAYMQTVACRFSTARILVVQLIRCVIYVRKCVHIQVSSVRALESLRTHMTPVNRTCMMPCSACDAKPQTHRHALHNARLSQPSQHENDS
jgi:hypothetical protein